MFSFFHSLDVPMLLLGASIYPTFQLRCIHPHHYSLIILATCNYLLFLFHIVSLNGSPWDSSVPHFTHEKWKPHWEKAIGVTSPRFRIETCFLLRFKAHYAFTLPRVQRLCAGGGNGDGMCACTVGYTHVQQGTRMHTGRYSINLEDYCGKIKFTEKNHILSVKSQGHLITKMSLQSTKEAARSSQCGC